MEQALVEVLDRASQEFSDRELLVLDIGIFPWFNSIEVSLLFVDDQCDREDIAAWPHFDYSNFNEGGWEQAKRIADQLSKEWSEGIDIVSLLAREALVVEQPSVQKALGKFNLAKNFTVQMLNSDDGNSPNYCAF